MFKKRGYRKVKNLLKELHNVVSQASIEFIMSYGWVILVVIIAIAAGAYFGVLSPDKFLPSKCTLSPGLFCEDFKVETSGITVMIQNSMPYDLEDVSVTFENCGGPVQGINYGTNLQKDEKDMYAALCDLSNTEKYKGSIIVSYKKGSGGIEKKMIGSILSRVGAAIGGVGVDQGACQTAQDSGLCDGLNLVYGDGYRAECCSQYSLCC